MRDALAARGVAWPAPLWHIETVASTNDWLKAMAREGAAAWTAVRADRQSSGRGRGGHAWISQPGDLFVSVILPPPGNGPLTLLPLLAGVAVAEAARGRGVPAQLKWPNDVLVGDRKLGGILVETTTEGQGTPTIVAGIGLNLALDPDGLAEPLRSSVTSVRALGVPPPAPDEAAAEVLARLFVWYHAFATGGDEKLRAAWRALAVDWWGRTVQAGAAVRGIVRDIDARGALILETEGGRRIAVMSGEVREIRLA
jgi:BirA family transcriptional regulator, biotin operon repressor / biotin---[acetyl-CoA-carboxylase] ligase